MNSNNKDVVLNMDDDNDTEGSNLNEVFKIIYYTNILLVLS